MVTSGNYASYYLALLPSENGETIDNWVLPLGTQGLTFEADSWNGLGMRSNVSCFMRMTDMPLDRSWRVEWNSPLAWLDGYLRSGDKTLNGAMRDTDQDRQSYLVVNDPTLNVG